MAEELQSLLDRIYSEGVKKAENQAATIVADARREAENIVAQARERADAMLRDASAEAANLQQRAESAVRQAARDIILQLKSELEKRMRGVLAEASGKALAPETMAEIALNVSKNDPEAEPAILCAPRDREALEKAILSGIGASFGAAPRVFSDPSIDAGLEVSLRNGDYYFDFTVPALTAMVAKLVGERIAAVLEK
ncbi:MAG: hypothetical protein MJ016_03175 [Victivallaceae bacterium]|nr:hypothetical protein [Victivallaceae bacterium]